MPHNNPSGKNGYGAKEYPPDDELRSSLFQYAKEKLTVKERLARLRVEHHLEIGKSRLMELNKKFDVPSARKPIHPDIATAAILSKVAADPGQRNGVGAIGTFLSNEGMSIPRDFIRHVLSIHAPEGLAARFPGVRAIPRSSLSAIGPFHQDHQDGHDKLNAQALGMGGVALPIYGIKDQWASFIKHLVTVPDNRLATTIGHVHLDCAEKYLAISVTAVMDKGSEVSYLFGNHTALRKTYAPDVDEGTYPPVVQVKSTHNTPIEGCWHWFLKTSGHDFKDVVKGGLREGIYISGNELHTDLFNWLWPQILQIQLDAFVDYWNNHRIRSQPNKPNISGTSPRQAFTVPQSFGGQDCRIAVEKEVLEALRAEIPVSREDAMCWVEDGFALRAKAAYETIGSPRLVPMDGWAIFQQLLLLLHD